MLLEKQLLYPSDVASLLGCCVHKVYEYLHTGKLRGYKDGRSWHIPAEAVDEFIRHNMQFYQASQANL